MTCVTRNVPKLLTLLVCATLTTLASATVTINANLDNPDGTPNANAFLTIQLDNCGYNTPIIPAKPGVIVTKTLTYAANQPPATIYGNDEISCGNVYSTLWHVTAYSGSRNPDRRR